jgi:type II secretory pathway pseudopilin PulG
MRRRAQLRPRRPALTLIELLMVCAIMIGLMTLIVSAVMRSREAAIRLDSSNNLKQISIALHHFASINRGMTPVVGDELGKQITTKGSILAWPDVTRPSIFRRLLPFVDGAKSVQKKPVVAQYLSPADPTIRLAKVDHLCSYAANAVAFRSNPRFPATFIDGMSNTIAFAEHYAKCQATTFRYSDHTIPSGRATFSDYGHVRPISEGPWPAVYPLKAVSPNVFSTAPGWTFQVAPHPSKCWASVPQTPHPGGMLVALVDGGVRQLSPSISERTFWGAVTPAAGETHGPDW